MSEFLSVSKVAERLGKSTADVRRMIADGRLQAHQFGKRDYSVSTADLDDFIAKSAVKRKDEMRVALEKLADRVYNEDTASREAAKKLLDSGNY